MNPVDIPPKEIEHSMPPLIITETEVTKLINKLQIDKSPGPDQIHPRYLKELVVAIATQPPDHDIKKNLLKPESYIKTGREQESAQYIKGTER